MTGFTIAEKIGDHDVVYEIYKNGKHSGAITVFLDGNTVLDGENFTTVMELASALQRSQVAVLSRAATSEEIMQSTAGSEASEHFIKNAVDHLKRLTGGRP